jgi:hypothetical protein
MSRYWYWATPLPSAVTAALVQQAILLFVTGALVFDNGRSVQSSIYAFAGFWIGAGVIIFRRRHTVTHVDLWLIRWGYVPLCVISFLVTWAIWSLRGF